MLRHNFIDEADAIEFYEEAQADRLYAEVGNRTVEF